ARNFLTKKGSLEIVQLYRDHIERRTGGKEDAKKSLDDYENSFQETIINIKENGFNSDQPIRINGDLLPITGAHRIAACLATKSPIWTQTVNSTGLSWDYTWFVQNAFSQTQCGKILKGYIELKPENTSIFILWGASKDRWLEIERLVEDDFQLIGSLDLKLDQNTLKQFIYEVYGYETGGNPTEVVIQKSLILENYPTEIKVLFVEFENLNMITRQNRPSWGVTVDFKTSIRSRIAKELSLENDFLALHTADDSDQTRMIASIVNKYLGRLHNLENRDNKPKVVSRFMYLKYLAVMIVVKKLIARYIPARIVHRVKKLIKNG